MNRTHLFLTKHKHMMTNLESCSVCLPLEFHGFTSRINSKGYHSLVPGLILIFLETVWVPLRINNKFVSYNLVQTCLITVLIFIFFSCCCEK